MARRYGVMARFSTPEQLVEAATALKSQGYLKLEAFTPFPVEELDEILDLRDPRIGRGFLFGAVLGTSGAFALQSYLTVIDYPLVVGGRPHFAWLAYLPVTFEMGVLLGAFCGLAMLLYTCGLPRLSHPVFSHPEFAAASRDKFFLCVQSDDHRCDPPQVFGDLDKVGAEVVYEV